MTTQLEAESISCRECGSPRELETACAACQASPPEADELSRLLLHRDRMVRSLQRLQALTVMVLIDSQPGMKGRWAQAVGVVLMLGFLGLFGVWFMPLSWSARLLLFAFDCAVLWACWVYLIRSETAARSRAYLETDETVHALGASRAARCPSCGGFTTLLCFDVVSTHPCPWCDARLVASTDAHSASSQKVATRLDDLLEEARVIWETADGSTHSSTQSGEGDTSFRALEHHGLPVWTVTVGFEDRLVHRYEMQAHVPIDRRLLFVQQELEPDVRRLGIAWRFPLPDLNVDTLEVGKFQWLVYSDTDAPLEDPQTLRIGLYALGEKDSLVLDRAGCSLWVYGLTNRHEHEELDALVSLPQELGVCTA